MDALEELYQTRLEDEVSDFTKDPGSVTEALSESLTPSDCQLLFTDPLAFGEIAQQKALKYFRELAELHTDHPTSEDL